MLLDCPQHLALYKDEKNKIESCSPCPAGKHAVSGSGLSTKCAWNKCVCKDPWDLSKTAGIGAGGDAKAWFQRCYVHGENRCLKCNPGFSAHLGNGICVESECRCHNGTPAKGKDCPQHGAQKCMKPKKCFHMENGTPRKNRCVCPHGKPEIGCDCGPKPSDHGKPKCSSCIDQGWKLSPDKTKCVAQCTCEHGKPVVAGHGCDTPMAKCLNCGSSSNYELNPVTFQCDPVCSCSHGTAARGALACPVPGKVCAYCDTGYSLVGKKCIPRCTCHGGTPPPLGDAKCTAPGPLCVKCPTGAFPAPKGSAKPAKCQENKCKCDNGSGTTGDQCPADGEKYCAPNKCKPGFDYLRGDAAKKAKSTKASNGKFRPICRERVCNCKQFVDGKKTVVGVAPKGAKCPVHGQLFCTSCKLDHGMILDAGKNRCKLKVCQCDDGFSAMGPHCPKDGKEVCIKCLSGFSLNKGKTKCELNKCRCTDSVNQPKSGSLKGSAGTQGERCHASGSANCASCPEKYEMFQLSPKDPGVSVCQAICTCKDGLPKNGTSGCPKPLETCASCEGGYTLSKGKVQTCKKNKCVCENGHAPEGLLQGNRVICFACPKRYRL